MSSPSHLDKVKKLRELTGVGFGDCNIAIKECGGDIEKSIKYLRIKGFAKAGKKMERIANDGLICVYEENNKLSIIEINCETDFAAKNLEFLNFSENLSKLCFELKGDLNNLKKKKMKDGNSVDDNVTNLISKIGEKITIRRCNFFDNNKYMNFSYVHAALKKNIGKLGVVVSIESTKFNQQIKDFGHKLAMHIAASSPLAIEVSQLDKKMLEKENEIIGEELKNSGKSDNIIEKISRGKLEKFKQENTLINQIWIMDPKKKVKDVIAELGKENSVTIKDFVRYKVGE
ncbi:MAG TPA: translation elongation factor Ts [Pelagibacteraceae bacterium]|jgi:elongation factor Ts|nr:translation elongation factor Ts [Pelagibacteraceae bacterium]